MSSLNYSAFYTVLALGIFLVLVAQLQLYSANASQNKLLDVPDLQSDNNLTTDTNSSTENLNNSTEFTTYKDDDFGFEIQYPSDWQVLTEGLTYELVLFSPKDEHSVKVDVKLIPREKHETLKQFGDKFFKKKEYFTISEYYRNPNTTFAGLLAIKTIGTAYDIPNVFERAQGKQDTAQKVLYIMTLLANKDTFFGVAYFADKSKFNQFLPTVQRMIDSVKLTNLKPQIIEED